MDATQSIELINVFSSSCDVSIDPTLTCGSPKYWVTFAGDIYFSADGMDGHGYQLWRTTGTTLSTIRLTLSSISEPQYLTIQSHFMYFTAETNISSTQNTRTLFIINLLNASIFSTNDNLSFIDDPAAIISNNNPTFLGALYDYYLFFGTSNNITDNNGNHMLSTTRIWMSIVGSVDITFLIDISNKTNAIYRWKDSDGGYDLIGNGIRCFAQNMKSVMYTTTFTNSTGYNCKMYFTALSINPSSFHNFTYQIWESDGTPNNTQLLKSPQPCPEGYYCTIGTSTANTSIDYQIGSQIYETATNQTTYYDNNTAPIPTKTLPYYPLQCNDGYFCPLGSMNPRGYAACPSGYYCPGTLISAAPIICEQGTFCPGFGNRDYYSCQPGTYSRFDKQSLCETCPIGYLCKGFDDLPSICPAGYICSQPALSSPDRICPSCYYCLEGTNTYKQNTSTVIAGYGTIIHEEIAVAPYLCEAGYYCLSGTATSANNSVRYDIKTPQICPSGFYCGVGSCSPTGYGPCAPGEYCPEGSITPQITSPGYYAPFYALSSEWICLPGSYANDSNLDQCDICPKGYECLGDGVVFPKACERGFFRDDLESIECARCPDGTYSNASGLTTEDGCTLCNAGWVCGTPGLKTHPIEEEFLCPQGFVCGEGTNLYESRVTQCPGGYYCNDGTTPQSMFDKPCEPGYFCPNGTSEATMLDMICPEGYFCPANNVTNGPGVHVILPCLDEEDMNYNSDCLLFQCPQGTSTNIKATSDVQCELFCEPALCETLSRVNPILGMNNLTFNTGTVLTLHVDWSNIPHAMEYYKHFVLNIYYVPSNGSMYNGVQYLVDTLDDAISKEPYLYPMGEWFRVRDGLIEHKRKYDLRIFINQPSIDVFVRVEIIHGTYAEYTNYFENTVNVTIFKPSRFKSNENDNNPAIYAMVKKEDIISEGLSLPYNLITNESFNSIQVELAVHDDIGISTIYQDAEQWNLFHDELFFEFGYQGSESRNMLVFPWFPYWSNCLNFESRLFINYMLEGEVNKYSPEENSTSCTIFDKETELQPVYSYDFGKSPITDYCNFELICQFEEEVGLGTRTRWWELSVGTTLFYLTREAQTNDRYEAGWKSFSTVYKNKLRYIPVTIEKSTQVPTDQTQIPTIITMNIFYFQKDVDTKILVDAWLEYDGWKDLPVGDSTGSLNIKSFLNNGSVRLTDGNLYSLQYKLNINYQAIAYWEIFNNLHFDIFPIYIAFYLFVGVIILIFMFFIFIFKRMCTKLRHPPMINLTSLGWLYLEPLFSGFLLSLIPTFLVFAVLYGIYLTRYPFDEISGSYTDIEDLTEPRIEKYRSGRLGYAMMLFGLYFLVQGSIMIIPRPKQIDFENIAWDPIKWKRFWLVIIALIMALFFVYLQQFSYSNIYVNSSNITYFVALFKFIHLCIHLLLEDAFKNTLLISPFIVTMSAIQVILIIASRLMTSFLINFVTLYLLQFIERMYILPFLRRILKLIPVYNARIQSKIYNNLGQRFESERYKSFAHDLMDEIDSRTMEPMIENLNKTSNDLLAYLTIPIILYFFYTFHAELSIADCWNINEYDLVYFLIFVCFIIPFLILSDLLLFNAQELYHSWPIYGYFKFARHRFLTRIENWKLSEFEFDETLDPVLRDLDTLCFSSQFYFLVSITSFGILFVYFGFTVTLNNDYPFISDSFFFTLTMFTLFTALLGRRVLVYMFRLSQIWKISKLPTIHFAVDEDDAPYDPLQHLRSKPVKNKFLEKNKNYLLENLAELITPDALERHRDYLMYHYQTILREKNEGKVNKYDISEDEDDESGYSDEDASTAKYKSVKLDKRQERVANWWLNRGKRLAEMKRLIDGIIASNLEHNCDECGVNENLTVQQFISFEDLVFEFDKKVSLGIDRMDKMHPVIAWRKFFQQTQLFRTLCTDCLANVQIQNIKRSEQQLISEDDSDEMDYRYEQYEVKFDKTTSKNIAALWLQAARGRIMRENPPSIPSLSISTNSEFSRSENDSDSGRVHLRRQLDDRVKIIRDDISSITETVENSYSESKSDDDNVKRVAKREDISEDTVSLSNDQQIMFYNDVEDDSAGDEENRYQISSDSSSNHKEDNVDVNRRIVRKNYDISSDSED